MTLLIWKYFNGIVLINKDSLLLIKRSLIPFSFGWNDLICLAVTVGSLVTEIVVTSSMFIFWMCKTQSSQVPSETFFCLLLHQFGVWASLSRMMHVQRLTLEGCFSSAEGRKFLYAHHHVNTKIILWYLEPITVKYAASTIVMWKLQASSAHPGGGDVWGADISTLNRLNFFRNDEK